MAGRDARLRTACIDPSAAKGRLRMTGWVGTIANKNADSSPLKWFGTTVRIWKICELRIEELHRHRYGVHDFLNDVFGANRLLYTRRVHSVDAYAVGEHRHRQDRKSTRLNSSH